MSTEVLEAADVAADEQEPEGRESGLLRRTFAAKLSAGDGRTIDARIVPYGEQIEHDDGRGGLPVGMMYREEWVPGAFSHQLNAANRVLVNFEHQEGLAGVVGHGLVLRDEPDGFYGSFRLHETPEGEKALMLVREGVLGGISLEALGRKSLRTSEGVVKRVKANLRAVALCRFPAYANARVLALREAAEDEPLPILDEELLPVEPDPELIERCRRLGIQLPQRYEAHPAETGTPAEAGTPEDGTRQSVNTPTSEDESEHNAE